MKTPTSARDATKPGRLGFWLEGLTLTLLMIASSLAIAAYAVGRVEVDGVGWLAASIAALACSIRGLAIVSSQGAYLYVAAGLVSLAVLRFLITHDGRAVLLAGIVPIAIVVLEMAWRRYGNHS